LFEFLVEALVGTASHQLREHVGSGGIAAAIEVCASDEKQGLGDMTFSGTGVACDDEPLFTRYKVQFCDLQELCFVDSSLERKVEIREEFTL